MVTIRNAQDIALNLIDFFNTVRPDLDIKGGTVARDLFIDAPSSQLSLLYGELSQISNLQSLRLVAASDLDKLAQNFGATRKSPVQSSGIALFTFSSIPAVVSINRGNIINGSTGSTFSVLNGISVDPAQLNSYRAIALKYQNNLNFLNITDQYAVEVSVQSTTAGAAGNISAYTLNSTAIPGVSNVTNVFPFTGGTDQENDASFRNRVLAIFSGSNIGTALGYRNTALSNSSVSDAVVVSPGNPLMTRDGTIVSQNTDGSFTIVSEGTGGKVDIIILGNILTSHTDSFVYQDQSNKNDPTDVKNIFTLGQIPGEQNLTIPQKRLIDIKNSTLPAQPVENILQVTGSLSGSNFISKSVDSLGRITGNFELIKDTGNYKNSPWGLDKFHWVSNKISLLQEDKIKSKFNGQDPTAFTDILNISKAQQNISITNENSPVSLSDRSIINLIHFPSTNITRVFNTNTGERYTVINQNLDGTGSVNITGRIQISGNTLPSVSDILQVDYTWTVSYDSYSDYDGKILKNNPRSNTDSIDWGISNAVRNENILFNPNITNTFFSGTSSHPISYIVSANVFGRTFGEVIQSTVPNFTNRYSIELTAIDNPINSITSISLTNSNKEIYITAQNDGFIINNSVVVGTSIKYNVIIVLPTDTAATISDNISIRYNESDTFNIVNSTGSFVGNNITIPFGNVPATPSSVYLDVTYIAAIQDVLSAGITSLPISRSGNGFITNINTGSINLIKSNISKKENQTIQKNQSEQFFITLNLSSNNYTLDGYGIITVIDLATGLEIWNVDFPGTIAISTGNQYQLIFSGFNNPLVGDNVLAIYYANDLQRIQPFTFANNIFSKNFQTAQFNFTNNTFYVPIHTFNVENNLLFNIIDTTTGQSIGSDTDGYISSANGLTTIFSSTTFNFADIDNLLGKTIQIHNPINRNNAGVFNILNYNIATNSIIISVVVSDLNTNQISVIRVADGKDLWTNQCTVDITNNLLNLPNTTLISQGDEVIVLLFTSKNLHQSPTRLSITASDQSNNTGKITVVGTTINEVQNVVFSATSNGLTQNILEAIKTSIGSNSNFKLPTNYYLIRVMKIEKVSTTTNNDVLGVLASYDITGTQLNNNLLYSNEMLNNTSLSNIQFIMPSTTNNINDAPQIGDKLRISFYYAVDGDSESVYFTKNGTLYSNKVFALIEQIYVASGFNTSQSAKLTVSYFTQPATGSRYTVFYDYLAPKQNERISINYNYNQLISSVTFSIENSRPINADVLVKAAEEILVNTTVNIVVSSTYSASSAIVLQNVHDKIVSTINTNTLNVILNSSDLIVAAQSVNGVERARIISFNIDGSVGQVLTLSAQANQFFAANNITVNPETI